MDDVAVWYCSMSVKVMPVRDQIPLNLQVPDQVGRKLGELAAPSLAVNLDTVPDQGRANTTRQLPVVLLAPAVVQISRREQDSVAAVVRL